MSKLSDAWMTLKMYGVDPQSAEARERARGDVLAFLGAPDDADGTQMICGALAFLGAPDDAEEARDVLDALNTVEARA